MKHNLTPRQNLSIKSEVLRAAGKLRPLPDQMTRRGGGSGQRSHVFFMTPRQHTACPPHLASLHRVDTPTFL
ncbi:hypothetical protein E2C01_068062 [Portunus trituberculatus]|uniref:Uncharacterized protein n=1 Tax=Portunus trituberculatus TaxID=210409 RepID=A0A5B7HVA9_PORTR|nr:hypothetical protein [Portunus trituberculatus]